MQGMHFLSGFPGGGQTTRALLASGPVLLAICMFLLAALPDSSAAAPNNSTVRAYVINLESRKTAPRKPDLRKFPELAGYHIYNLTFTKGGVKWYRLRMGFFAEHREAIVALRGVKKHFKQAWVDRINPAEATLAQDWMTHEKTPITIAKTAAKIPAGSKASELMERARQAMIDGKYLNAVAFYTNVISITTGEAQKEPREFLGLAREKNGQLSHAQAEYEEYLRRFPEGTDAERVRQRLLGIVTATSTGRDKLSVGGKSQPKPEWDFVSSLSQFYRYQVTTLDGVGTSNSDNSLDSDINSNGRYRGIDYDMRYQMDASYHAPFIGATKPTDLRLTTAYFELSAKGEGVSLRAGRQTYNSDGVLGRFDGVIMGYRYLPQWKLNVLYGYPVDLTVSNQPSSVRNFQGLSLNIGTLAQHWNLNVYGIQQMNEGLIDRTAIGGEAKYVADTYSTLTLLDYDVEYSELNTLLFVGNWRLKNQGTFSLTMDYRNSPPLTTSNALIGQTVTSLTQLLQTYSQDQVRQLARDRTARYSSVTISLDQPLNPTFQFNADATLSNLSAMPASGGVTATPDTGNELYASTQLTADNLFKRNEITIAGLRYASTGTATTNTATLSTRFPFKNKWRASPQLRIDQQARNDNTNITLQKLVLKLDYRRSRNWQWQFELGNEATETRGSVSTTHDTNNYIYGGYIFDF